MFPVSKPWELLFAAGYIVHPSKGLEPEVLTGRVIGSASVLTRYQQASLALSS